MIMNCFKTFTLSALCFLLTLSTGFAGDLSGVVTDATSSATDGAIDLTITGGVSPYTVSWTGPGGFMASTEDISSLAYGLYTVTVSDLYCGEATTTFMVDSAAPSGITTLSPISELSIYPIPFQEDITIDFESSENAELDMLLIDVTGKVVFSGQQNVTEGENKFSLSFAKGMSNGQYKLLFFNGESVVFSKSLIRLAE